MNSRDYKVAGESGGTTGPDGAVMLKNRSAGILIGIQTSSPRSLRKEKYISTVGRAPLRALMTVNGVEPR